MEEKKKCPFCQSDINAQATVCPFCRSNLSATDALLSMIGWLILTGLGVYLIFVGMGFIF